MAKDGFYTMSFKFDQPAIVAGGSPIGTITSRFGAMEEGLRTHPHTGIDYACPVGTEVHAPVDGVVSAVRDYGDVNLGKAVFVKMEDGQQYTVGHLSKQSVHVGDEIKTGDLLGLSGNTGNSTGPHLHFGAYDSGGRAIDPGNITWDAFQVEPTVAVEQVKAMGGNLDPHYGPVIPHPEEVAKNAISGAGKWFSDKMSDGAHAIFEPIGNALGDGFHALFVGTMHALPMILVAGGLVCYLITMALSHHKPYFMGLGMWAMSAVIRGINIELGI